MNKMENPLSKSGSSGNSGRSFPPMKSKLFVFLLALFAAAAVTGCQGIKASTDNAEVKKGLHYDASGKLTDDPEVSVPVWSSKGLKQKPQDVTPAKE